MDVLLVVLVVARILPAPYVLFFNVFSCSSFFFILVETHLFFRCFWETKRRGTEMTVFVYVCVFQEGKGREGEEPIG